MRLIACIALLSLQGNLGAQTIVEQGTSKVFSLQPSGKLVYSKDARGNRLPDFSYVGYHSGEKAIPNAPVKITLEPGTGDDTKRIQTALDRLGRLPLDASGIRGALLLKRGTYRVGGGLVLSQSGSVLRGEGNGPNGTVIVATGYGKREHQRTLITVASKRDRKEIHTLHHEYVVDPIKLGKDSRQAITDYLCSRW